MAIVWGKLKGAITKRIMTEDLAIIPNIQAGLEKSTQPGVLGRCEERIHAFRVFARWALSNVCAHRHCLLTNEPRGNSPRMTCQYHGWEYGSDGKTRKIPQPKNFVPFPEERECIGSYRVDTCGQIVFVCLAEGAADLPAFLGEYHGVIASKFGSRSKEFLRLDLDNAANWKVPVENSLEAYHVPNVHPSTFGDDPGEERSTHVLSERSTAFGTGLPFSTRSRDRLLENVAAGRATAPARHDHETVRRSASCSNAASSPS